MMFTKVEVKFEHPARGPHHCSQCEYFMPTVSACRIVRGEVEAGDWCSQFEPKESK